MKPLSDSSANEYHSNSHSVQHQIRQQSSANENIDGNRASCSIQNENNVGNSAVGTAQTMSTCSINKNDVDRNCISRNSQMTDWYSQWSQSSNLSLYTWPEKNPPSAINQPSNCSSECTKLKQELLEMRNNQSVIIDKYIKLDLSYAKVCEELKQQKQEELNQREIAETKIHLLLSARHYLQVERQILYSDLQEAYKLITIIRRQNSILRERLKAIASQMSSRREDNQSIQKSEQLQNRLAKLQPNCEEIPNEKRLDFEVKKLGLQLQHLEEEKSQLEQWNNVLCDELKFWENKIRAREELQKNKLTSFIDRKCEASQHSNEKLPWDVNLQSVPKDLLKELQIYKSQNGELKSHLEQLNKELSSWQETAKLYESYFSESKKNPDVNKIKKNHETELADIKNQYENKISYLDKEIKILRDSLSQIEEEKNKFKVLNNMLLDQKEVWNKEQTEYQKTKLKLEQKIKEGEELEAKLQVTVNKYESHIVKMEQKHQEEISKLQLQISELAKSGCQEENKTGEIVLTQRRQRSLKTLNILTSLKNTEEIMAIECNLENMREKY